MCAALEVITALRELFKRPEANAIGLRVSEIFGVPGSSNKLFFELTNGHVLMAQFEMSGEGDLAIRFENGNEMVIPAHNLQVRPAS